MISSKVLTLILLSIGSPLVVSKGLVDDIDWTQMAFLFNESCGPTCGSDLWEGPPDIMASMPPPPLPPFLQLALADNNSFDSENCNLCHLFSDPNAYDDSIVLPKPEVKDSDSWLSVLVATILGSTLLGALFLVLLFKCKKYFKCVACSQISFFSYCPQMEDIPGQRLMSHSSRKFFRWA